MKTLSIRGLHAKTGKIARATQNGSFFVTAQGNVAPITQEISPHKSIKHPFPKGHWTKRKPVRSKGDSTRYISNDRNR